MIKKFDELQKKCDFYRGLMKHIQGVLKRIFHLAHVHRCFGDAFANIGAREPQLRASLAFTRFGDAHRKIDQYAITLLRTVQPVPPLSMSLFHEFVSS